VRRRARSENYFGFVRVVTTTTQGDVPDRRRSIERVRMDVMELQELALDATPS